jgi:hypothetical protein
MQRTESVGSITSALENISLSQPPTYEELKQENKSLKEELKHEKETNDILLHDAARWNFAKKNLFLKLGFQEPKDLDSFINKEMNKNFLESSK